MAVERGFVIAFLMIVLTVASGRAAAEPKCVTHVEHGKCTKYTILLQQPPPEDCDCESWNNASNVVLANCNGSVSSVLDKTNTSLTLKECVETIVFKLTCQNVFIITCAVNCTSENPKQEEREFDNRIVAYVVLACVVVLAVLGLIVYLRKRRRNDQRTHENDNEVL